MGTLRFILALSVALSHTKFAGFFGNSALAVECFYTISGFLISFVLRNDKAYQSVGAFYLNRALRLYPIYWIIAAVSLAVHFGTFRSFYAGLNILAALLLALSNAGILFQDWFLFIRQHGAGLEFTADIWTSSPRLYGGLLVPQAWSLGVELTFYLIAPFVLRSHLRTFGLFAVSLALRLYGASKGLHADPWSYRFFPFELSMFLAGALAQQLLLPKLANAAVLVKASPVVAIAAFLAYPYAGAGSVIGYLAPLCVTVFCLPLLFEFQHGRKWDTYIGDLSYPLYICHHVCLDMFTHFRIMPAVVAAGLGLAASLIMAALLERVVAQPVERMRRRIRRAKAPVDMIGDSSEVVPIPQARRKSLDSV